MYYYNVCSITYLYYVLLSLLLQADWEQVPDPPLPDAARGLRRAPVPWRGHAGHGARRGYGQYHMYIYIYIYI